MTTWSSDFLDGYETTDLALSGVEPAAGEPADVELVATLIRKTSNRGGQRAALYLHGWNDYFFQTHLADYLTDLGYDFYALDLRRYGRSLRPGHMRGFITNLDDYAVELDAATDLIAADHDRLLLMGHSMGGLVAVLWASRNADRLEGLILNSPWLDLQGSAIVRTLGTPVIDAMGTRAPTSVLRLPTLGFNARSLHISLGGEWDYDLTLKSTPSPPIRTGWLRAMLQGHQRVAAGLGIAVPILVLASTTTDFSRRWHEGLRTVDSVLDVEQIAARSVRLGPHVTVVRIPEGLHDLILSAPHVRKQALDEIGRFVEAYVKRGPVLLDGSVGGGVPTD
ncbi:MAG TPA: alpha/beta hydrolase [Propionibacteriaceae bacterium]|nr:alpha/beta hydrolase [Propionibacteriaceae bacterium]